jgi:hypothetical protein
MWYVVVFLTGWTWGWAWPKYIWPRLRDWLNGLR